MPLLTGGQKPIFADDAATLLALAGTNFNPRTEVYLPPEARGTVTATNVATMRLSAEQFSAPEIDADVDASAPTMLVAAQSYYHPWRAYVDGGNVPLFRANYAFQAVAIPQGKHHVRLIYRDWAFEIGAVISIATLLGSFLYYFRLRRHQ
jgi:Bacterial membrane protein YfhO